MPLGLTVLLFYCQIIRTCLSSELHDLARLKTQQPSLNIPNELAIKTRINFIFLLSKLDACRLALEKKWPKGRANKPFVNGPNVSLKHHPDSPLVLQSCARNLGIFCEKCPFPESQLAKILLFGRSAYLRFFRL